MCLFCSTDPCCEVHDSARQLNDRVRGRNLVPLKLLHEMGKRLCGQTFRISLQISNPCLSVIACLSSTRGVAEYGTGHGKSSLG